MSALPHFQVREIENHPLRLIGELSNTRYGSQTWIRSGWLGDLRVGSRFVRGRWSEADGRWVFAPNDQNALETIAELREFDVFDGYWGERAELVLDESLTWRETDWSDPEDHDHCQICWDTINLNENARHFKVFAAVRICPACYSNYVEPRNVDFSKIGGPAA
jgi:hypothetical protein